MNMNSIDFLHALLDMEDEDEDLERCKQEAVNQYLLSKIEDCKLKGSPILLLDIEELLSTYLLVFHPVDGFAIRFAIEYRHICIFKKLYGYQLYITGTKFVFDLTTKALTAMDFLNVK